MIAVVRRGIVVLALFGLVVGCEAPPPAATSQGAVTAAAEPSAPRPVKRVVTAIAIEPDFGPGRPISGAPAFRVLARGAMTIPDARGVRQGQLAESAPTIENGLWRVLPDGRMETTWKIREGAVWHDGHSLTTDDLLFTATVLQDRRVPEFRTEAYDWIESVAASDARTLAVRWSRPFIGADALFSHEMTPAFPRHLLEATYLEDAPSVAAVSYWREDFVGSGAFKLREWVPGSHAVFDANERYVLGRPRLDVIEVRFIPDATTRVANVLAGAVDVTLGAGLTIEQALQAAPQWSDGRAVVELTGNWLVLLPQFVNPNPTVVADLRLRRALLHAIDRQAMADTLQLGQTPVAHSYTAPNQPQYGESEARVRRYEYDPRIAAQLMDDLGYTKGSDGMYRATTGGRTDEPLGLSLRSAAGDVNSRAMLATADYWGKLGIVVNAEAIAPQRAADLEYVATFPAFYITSTAHDVRGAADLHSSRARLPENNFRVPGLGNQSRYRSAELDALVDRYQSTIPQDERARAMGDISVHIAEHLSLMGLTYGGSPELIANRILNVASHRAITNPWNTWNAHAWDLRP